MYPKPTTMFSIFVLGATITFGTNTLAHESAMACVQRELASLGYAPGPDDGVAGSRTRNALAAYRETEAISAQLPDIADSTAVNWCTRIAKRHPEVAEHAAVTWLGLAQAADTGDEATQNLALASRWYGFSAEAGNAAAQLRLGAMHEQGEGVAQSNILASKWYLAAAKAGNAEAQFIFGSRFAYSDELKTKWLSDAAAQGNENAVKALEELTAD